MPIARPFAPDLPQEALVRILEQLQQEDRLTAAALVSTSWAAAAGAATTAVAISEDNFCAETLEGLNSWLQQHPGQVESITMAGDSSTYSALQLPCSQLTRLQALALSSCAVRLQGPAAGGHPGPLRLPALQALSLSKADIPHASLASLQLPNLTSLTLDKSPNGWRTTTRQAEVAIAAALRGLPLLLELRLSNLMAGNAALAPLSSLRRLQSCSIEKCSNITPEVLSDLRSSSLTALTFAPSFLKRRIFIVDDVPAAGWPQLQLLAVYHTPMQPAMLDRMPALQVLDLWDCPLLPTEQVDEVDECEEEAAGASELLAALAQLTQLRRLELFEINLEAVERHARAVHVAQGGAPWTFTTFTHLRQFSSLTASDQLESLVLTYRDEQPQLQPLPRNCIEEMFPPGRQLLQLTELVLDALCPEDLEGFVTYVQEGSIWDSDDDEDDWEARERRNPWVNFWSVDPMDLPHIWEACPNLRRLTLNSVLPSEYESGQCICREVRRLSQLRGLTHLCLGGPWILNQTAAALAEVTRLRSLKLVNTPCLRAAGLEKLTALRRLRRLEVSAVGFQRGVDFELQSQAQVPDVWRQLSQQVRCLRAEQEEAGADDWEVRSDDSMLQDSEDGCREAMARGWFPVASSTRGLYYVHLDALRDSDEEGGGAEADGVEEDGAEEDSADQSGDEDGSAEDD